MNNFRTILLVLIPLLFLAEGLLLYKKNIGSKAAEYVVKKKAENYIKNKIENITEKIIPKKVVEQSFQVTHMTKEYKTVDDVFKQLETWNKEAPSMTDLKIGRAHV